MWALISAEEQGVTQKNVKMAWGANLTSLGLIANWPYHVIKAVGNFGEIWNRNIGPYAAAFGPRGQNEVYTNGGLHYPPPGIK